MFKTRGILDPRVYKDENSLRLLGNYRAIFSYLSEHYEAVGQVEPLLRLIKWAEGNIELNWHTLYVNAQRLFDMGSADRAGSLMEKAVSTMISVYSEDPNASYENLVTMGDIVHDRYNDSESGAHIQTGYCFGSARNREPTTGWPRPCKLRETNAALCNWLRTISTATDRLKKWSKPGKFCRTRWRNKK